MRILPVSAQDRIEKDSLGEIRVAAGALWGAQTQRAADNLRIGRDRMPAELVRAIGLIKWAAAETNGELGELPAPLAAAIADAALEIAAGRHAEQFPLGVYQTGSGTSTNMNVNEVIAHLASRGLVKAVHPNDHVNRCQSSNDVIPTAIHVAAALALRDRLLPALHGLAASIGAKAGEVGDQVKPGRTHLMDALPVTVGQEMTAWKSQVEDAIARIEAARTRVHRLALGATAVGTGVNAHPAFANGAIARLGARTGLPFTGAPDRFASLAAQDTAVELSGTLRGAAVVLLKIANDLRWMNSGPLAGLAEIALPALQPGSSIMPGKINPVIPEAVAMAATAVMARDASVGMAGASGNFQLNVMLPLIADAVLESIGLLADSSAALAERVIPGITVNAARISESLARNPMLLTALAPRIGYDRAAAIAKRAATESRPILEIAVEESGLPRDELARLLDPLRLARGDGSGS
ncbi:MAG TPA: class II fumarate hydratase [Steroidobacteraceae bacterium]|nr:class II fumarate hydratase [Steroidobacteraceae bacterium]